MEKSTIHEIKEYVKEITLNNYYDNGYMVRYGETAEESENKIKEYSVAVAERYMELLGLEITINDAVYFSSAIDNCKEIVTNNNIDTLCEHDGIIHTDRNNVLSDFKGSHSGNEVITNAFWTAHKIHSIATDGEPEYNRSCSSGNCIFLLDTAVGEHSREVFSIGILMHELSHQYSGDDHYHELADKANADSCLFKAICSECGENPRPQSCIMNSSHQIINKDTILCELCKSEILAHLEHHHEYEPNA